MTTALLRTCEPPSLHNSLLRSRRIRPLSRTVRVSPFARARSKRSAMAVSAASATAEEGLRKGIAEFYDESSGLWENIWGDHMHHGYYDSGEPVEVSDHRSAQIRMVEEALKFAGGSGNFSLFYHFRPRPLTFWWTVARSQSPSLDLPRVVFVTLHSGIEL